MHNTWFEGSLLEFPSNIMLLFDVKSAMDQFQECRVQKVVSAACKQHAHLLAALAKGP